MKTILVTGGAGFIGSHVCDKLLSIGFKVICVDNLNSYYNPVFKKNNIAHNLKNNNFKFYKVDITRFNELHEIFLKHDINYIVHLAARAGVRPSISNPHIYEVVNIKGTLNLLDLAKDFNINNFVFGSSSSVYGANKKIPFSESDSVDEQVSPYAVTKRAGELFCNNYHKLYGLNIVVLRFFTVYGPRGRPDMAPYLFTEGIINGNTIKKYGDGYSARDYTYVGDIVNGIVSSLDKNFGFEIINLGNSEIVSLNKFIKVVETIVGKKAKIKQEQMPVGDVPITYADISKAKKLLNYKPKIKIEEGLKKFVEWYKNERV